jgi:hypothetical protein
VIKLCALVLDEKSAEKLLVREANPSSSPKTSPVASQKPEAVNGFCGLKGAAQNDSKLHQLRADGAGEVCDFGCRTAHQALAILTP